MATPSKMTPSKNAIPFATGTVLPAPVIAKIDRGIQTLAVNYGLKSQLRWLYLMEPTPAGVTSWTFNLYVVDVEAGSILEMSKLPKPLVTINNRSIGGINKFLTECGRVIAKTYGQQESKTRRTA